MSSHFDLILEKTKGKQHPTRTPEIIRAGRGCCPVCGGRKDKLSIGELADGGILLYCFGQQCQPHEIAQALGFEPSDLFPSTSTPGKHHSRGVRGWDWWSLMAAQNHMEDESRRAFVELTDLLPPDHPARLTVARLAGEFGALAGELRAGRGRKGGA